MKINHIAVIIFGISIVTTGCHSKKTSLMKGKATSIKRILTPPLAIQNNKKHIPSIPNLKSAQELLEKAQRIERSHGAAKKTIVQTYIDAGTTAIHQKDKDVLYQVGTALEKLKIFDHATSYYGSAALLSNPKAKVSLLNLQRIGNAFAISELGTLAEQKDKNAQQAFVLYLKSLRMGGHDKTLSHLENLASGLDKHTQYELGQYYESPLIFKHKNQRKASHWYLMASVKGYPPAIKKLKSIGSGQDLYAYASYLLNKKDTKNGLKFLELSIIKDSTQARDKSKTLCTQEKLAKACVLVSLYYRMNKQDNDYEQMIAWLQKAKILGSPTAKKELSEILPSTLLDPKNRTAITLLTEAQKLEKENQINKAALFYAQSAHKENQTAYSEIQRLAKTNTQASYLFGLFHEVNKDEEDYDEAVKWYLKSALNKHALAQAKITSMTETAALVKLAKFYEKENQISKAIPLYIKASFKDTFTAIDTLKTYAMKGNGEAIMALGDFYHEVEGDDREATIWYLKAIKLKNKPALIQLENHKNSEILMALGSYYEAQKNLKKSIPLYAQSARMGSKSAIIALEKLANQKIEEACYQLGLIYETEPQKRNFDEAIAWYKKAKELKHSKANLRLRGLGES